jgi:hypothetical protein
MQPHVLTETITVRAENASGSFPFFFNAAYGSVVIIPI